MRFFVLALMMVLLPLRAWTGDAMATDMAVTLAAEQMQQTAPKLQESGSHHGHQHHENHHDHAAHEAEVLVSANTADCISHVACDQTHGTHHAGETCESCSACQACHNVPLLVGATELKSDLSALWTLNGLADPFVSAEAAPDQKPPIS
jgi:hypothetical protein